jgi:hypothetical protein
MNTEYTESLNPLFDAAKKHAKKQKGLGYFVKLNAGNVEANVDAFNHANTPNTPSTSGTTADGGTGAVAAVAESIDDDNKIYAGVFYFGYKGGKEGNYYNDDYFEVKLLDDNNWIWECSNDNYKPSKSSFDTAKNAYLDAQHILQSSDDSELCISKNSNEVENQCINESLDIWKDNESQLNKRHLNIEESSLEEVAAVHDVLNPKIWDSNDEMLPDVKDKLVEITNTFVADLQADDIYIDVIDTLVVGSNASYNYKEDSDMDVHIIASSAAMDDDKAPLMNIIYNDYRTKFNEKYNISIRGVPVELYVEDDQTSVTSNGIYSINNGWIKKPVKIETPKVDISDLLDAYKAEYEEVIKSEDEQKISDLIDKIYLMRKSSIITDGEYGKGNLVFKELRSLNYIDNLRNKKDELVAKKLTIEEGKKTI